MIPTKPACLDHVERVVLFDGLCNLCNNNVLFLIRHDKNQRLKFCRVQSTAGQEILSWLNMPLDVHESILLLENDRLYEKSDAVLRIAYHLPWYLGWISAGRILPRFIRDNIYLFVARNRYRIMGRKDVCAMPDPELLSRFIS